MNYTVYRVSLFNQSTLIAVRSDEYDMTAKAGRAGMKALGYEPAYTGQHDLTIIPVECNEPTVALLASPVQCGDWHDRPLRYAVQGPGSDLQLQGNKRDAIRYASIRRRSANQGEAIRASY